MKYIDSVSNKSAQIIKRRELGYDQKVCSFLEI